MRLSPAMTRVLPSTALLLTLLSGCGGGGSSSPGTSTALVVSGISSTSRLFYYHYVDFTVSGTGLTTPGLTLTDTSGKCKNPAIKPDTVPTNTTLQFQCAVLDTGTLNLEVRDASNTLLSSQSFTVLEPKVRIATSLGNMDVLLNPTAAPITVQNFLGYVAGTVAHPNFYNNTIFHRVIKNFMIQGGGFTTGPVQKTPLFYPINLESNNGLKNERGTIAMARTTAPNSATAQFFINHCDNSSNLSKPLIPSCPNNLDYNPSLDAAGTPMVKADGTGNGYTVFGTIVAGDIASFATLDAIAAVATQTTANVPVTDVTITSVTQTQ